MTKLWCVHVIGPDTIIAQPDRETAERRANEWNAAIEARPGERHIYDPVIWCIPQPYPYDAAGHAEQLAEHGGQPEDIC